MASDLTETQLKRLLGSLIVSNGGRLSVNKKCLDECPDPDEFLIRRAVKNGSLVCSLEPVNKDDSYALAVYKWIYKHGD